MNQKYFLNLLSTFSTTVFAVFIINIFAILYALLSQLVLQKDIIWQPKIFDWYLLDVTSNGSNIHGYYIVYAILVTIILVTIQSFISKKYV